MADPDIPGQPASNRTPTLAEQHMGAAFLEPALALFPTSQMILAVGRVAQKMLDKLARDYLPLRHPSQGGKVSFIAGLQAAVERDRQAGSSD